MKKRLLFIIWSHSFGGGAEKQLTNLVNNLDKNKYDIDIIEYFHVGIKKEETNKNIHVLHPINDKTKECFIKREIIDQLVIRVPQLVRNLYIKKKYDVEISCNYQIPTFLLSNDPNVKKISWIHCPIRDLTENWQIECQRKSLSRVNKIVAIADDTYDSICELYPDFKDKTVVVNNGYDFEKMKTLSNKYKVKKSDKFEMLYCNRFDTNKNPMFLIEVARLLKEKKLNFHINFLGKGELEEEMVNKINEYGLKDNITIVGYVANPYPYIKATDLMCLTSYVEGFSTTLLEGFYFKKPFVSTRGAIPKEAFDKNLGYISDDVEEYANMVEKICLDKDDYKNKSKMCFEYSKNFALEKQVRKFEKLIDE